MKAVYLGACPMSALFIPLPRGRDGAPHLSCRDTQLFPALHPRCGTRERRTCDTVHDRRAVQRRGRIEGGRTARSAREMGATTRVRGAGATEQARAQARM